VTEKTFPTVSHFQPKSEEDLDTLHEMAEEVFTYIPWNDDQKEAGASVRLTLQTAWEAIITHVPPCATRTRALNDLVDARMKANAAISHNGKY
jgi:hypothetical protein